jgi:IS4 transposase
LINPDGKSKKKGGTKILLRVIEYTIDTEQGQQTYRLITSLQDITLFPALLLAAEYHQRWEIENTIDELKTHLLGRKTPIRSLKPREVVQEIYGWLLGHYAVRHLMFQAA